MDLQIPELEVSQKLFFNPAAFRISLMLQRRQWAYRLMVIERATGKEFFLPPNLSPAEMSLVAFAYRAIVERSFVWPIEEANYYTRYPPEVLAQLPPDNSPVRYQIGPLILSKNLLGQLLSLGTETMIIEDMVFQNAEEARRELALGDGHPVEVIIRSLSGQARFELPEVPRLPDAPWDERIQQLINLESQLDASIVARYHALAAATLADLTEEEKKEITAPV